MRIIKVADDVFKFSPEHCDGAVFWLKTGFNVLFSHWQFGFRHQCEELGCHFFMCNDGARIETEVDPVPAEGTLYQLNPKLNELEWVYIHPNQGNKRGAESNAVHQMMLDALDALSEKGCCRIAMNGIHGVTSEGQHVPEADREHSQLMVQALRDWCASRTHKIIERVYLVDLDAGFGPAENENRRHKPPA